MNEKKAARTRFVGLMMFGLALNRAQLRAAKVVYAPGGAGCEAAAARFHAEAAGQKRKRDGGE